MRQADLADVTKLIVTLTRADSLSPRIGRIEVEPDEQIDGTNVLHVSLFFDHTDDLTWDLVKPLVTSIEQSVYEIDDRFPVVHLADPV
jgi:hypothetical protein